MAFLFPTSARCSAQITIANLLLDAIITYLIQIKISMHEIWLGDMKMIGNTKE